MRLLIQRVTEARCHIAGEVFSQIGKGLVVLVGVGHDETPEDLEWLTKKLVQLRIFDDEAGVMNLSVQDVEGDVMIVSQFTLHALTKKGNRPSFTRAGEPQMAEQLYEYIIEQCKKEIPVVEHGSFGADMKISLLNDGPFTVILDSAEILG